jgi:AcrR family transcriptional regulator
MLARKIIVRTSTQRLPTHERRRQIAEAALDIIAEQGVHQLTTLEIARRVGIADGSLFRHFADKKEIVAAAIDSFEQMMIESLPEKSDEPLRDLERFFVNRLKLAHRRPDMLRLAWNDRLAEAAGENGALRVATVVQRSVGFVADCLERARARAEIATDIPLEVMLWMVLGVLQGAARAGPSKDRRSRDGLEAEALWRGLGTALRRTAPEPEAEGEDPSVTLER